MYQVIHVLFLNVSINYVRSVEGICDFFQRLRQLIFIFALARCGYQSFEIWFETRVMWR